MDRRRNVETRRVYYDDGRVEAFDGKEWWRVCNFSDEQVQQAKEAIRVSGLMDAQDMTSKGVYDTATLTYSWSFNGRQGSVTNFAYPARKHPAFEKLDARLDVLVDAAGKPDEVNR
jgi:hypothetical protein